MDLAENQSSMSSKKIKYRYGHSVVALFVSIFIIAEISNAVVCFCRQDVSDDAIMAPSKAQFHVAACMHESASHVD